jgi:hypothetical protein
MDTVITFTCDKCHTTASFDTAQIHPDDDFRCMACTDGMLHLPAKDQRTMNTYTATATISASQDKAQYDVERAVVTLEAIQTNLPCLVVQRLHEVLLANTRAHDEARAIEDEINHTMRCRGQEPYLLFFNVNHVVVRSEGNSSYFSEYNGTISGDTVPCMVIEAKRVGNVWQTTVTENLVLELPL